MDIRYLLFIFHSNIIFNSLQFLGTIFWGFFSEYLPILHTPSILY